MFNCKLGSLPIQYLGVPISDRSLSIDDLRGVMQKMGKRLEPWKGKNMSSAGRLILTNSCLTSVPMYTMGFYLLKNGLHKEMDKLRAQFFLARSRSTIQVPYG